MSELVERLDTLDSYPCRCGDPASIVCPYCDQKALIRRGIEELERMLRDTLDAVQRADFAEMERVARKARAVLEKKGLESESARQSGGADER